MAKREKTNDSNDSGGSNVTPEWAERLRERARAIGMTDIAVARRIGLSQSRYASYVGGKREPDFQTFLKICETLATRPDIILGVESSNPSVTAKEAIRIRAISALEAMDTHDQTMALASVEAMAEASLSARRATPQPSEMSDERPPKPSRGHSA